MPTSRVSDAWGSRSIEEHPGCGLSCGEGVSEVGGGGRFAYTAFVVDDCEGVHGPVPFGLVGMVNVTRVCGNGPMWVLTVVWTLGRENARLYIRA
jgi:hypothetical protein